MNALRGSPLGGFSLGRSGPSGSLMATLTPAVTNGVADLAADRASLLGALPTHARFVALALAVAVAAVAPLWRAVCRERIRAALAGAGPHSRPPIRSRLPSGGSSAESGSPRAPARAADRREPRWRGAPQRGARERPRILSDLAAIGTEVRTGVTSHAARCASRLAQSSCQRRAPSSSSREQEPSSTAS